MIESIRQVQGLYIINVHFWTPCGELATVQYDVLAADRGDARAKARAFFRHFKGDIVRHGLVTEIPVYETVRVSVCSVCEEEFIVRDGNEDICDECADRITIQMPIYELRQSDIIELGPSRAEAVAW